MNIIFPLWNVPWGKSRKAQASSYTKSEITKTVDACMVYSSARSPSNSDCCGFCLSSYRKQPIKVVVAFLWLSSALSGCVTLVAGFESAAGGLTWLLGLFVQKELWSHSILHYEKLVWLIYVLSLLDKYLGSHRNKTDLMICYVYSSFAFCRTLTRVHFSHRFLIIFERYIKFLVLEKKIWKQDKWI